MLLNKCNPRVIGDSCLFSDVKTLLFITVFRLFGDMSLFCVCLITFPRGNLN